MNTSQVTSDEMLDRELLVRLVAGSTASYRVEIVTECESTNVALAGRAREGAAHATVLACEHQTQGIGRRGRRWYSSQGGGLTFSVLWRFASIPPDLSSLGMVVALAVSMALDEAGARNVRLKWPNDIYCDERKMGGVLVEWIATPGGGGAAVIGIGLNARLTEEDRRQIDQEAVAWADAGCGATRTQMLALILRRLAVEIPRFAEQGFAPFREAWLQRQHLLGRDVRLVQDGKTSAEGSVLGVDADGALLLQCGNATRKFYGGEMSLRAS